MAGWGVCATIRAPAEQVLAFALHHLDLGADHIWLHFDDPADPALGLAALLPRTSAIACDADYWTATCGRRPDAHQNRQSRNVQRIYGTTKLDWLVHLDHDEFLLPSRSISDLLDNVPVAQPIVRAAPFEALCDPSLPDDIFTARHFRGALRGAAMAGIRSAVLGPVAPLLPEGMLSHAVGKSFFRTGIAGLKPQIHGAFLAGERVEGGAFHPDLVLLHFHATDRSEWLSRLDFRLARGGYRSRPEMVAFLQAASTAERSQFFDRVQICGPEKRDLLQGNGALRTAALGLREKVGRSIPAGAPDAMQPAPLPSSGRR
jgi:hypothetical protein